MRNTALVIIGIVLFIAFGIQVLMFYRIHEKLDQQFSIEKSLDLSSHQGSDTWFQDNEKQDPYRELFHLRNQMEKIFDASISRLQKNPSSDTLTQTPAIDLIDEANRYVVKVDVPGADESTLNVALDARQLTISIKTENLREQPEDNNKYQRRERFSGEFLRSITLPGDVDQKGIKTEYSNGVLTIILPKA